MVDWELMSLAEDDQFLSDEARSDRDRLRHELQFKVPSSVAGLMFAWWLTEIVCRVAWSAAVSLVRRPFRRAPMATADQAAVGQAPCARPAQEHGDIAHAARVADSAIRTT